MRGLRDYEHIIRGTCDGRPASLTITLATRERPGRLVLRAGSLEREVPATFLDASLVTNDFYYTGLGCDGQRLKLSARAIGDDSGEIVLIRQSATLDMHTGQVSLSELTRFSPEETRAELTEGIDATIDANGRRVIPGEENP